MSGPEGALQNEKNQKVLYLTGWKIYYNYKSPWSSGIGGVVARGGQVGRMESSFF